MDGGFRRLKLSSSTNNKTSGNISYNTSGTRGSNFNNGRDEVEAQPLRNTAPRKSEIERAVYVGNNRGLLRKISTSRTDTQTVRNYNRSTRTTITPEENVPCPVLICNKDDHEHNWQEGCYMMVRLSTQQLARRASEAAIQGGYEDLPDDDDARDDAHAKGSLEDLQEESDEEPVELNPGICNAVGPAWTHDDGPEMHHVEPAVCDYVPPKKHVDPVICDYVPPLPELHVDPANYVDPLWNDTDKPSKKVAICEDEPQPLISGQPQPLISGAPQPIISGRPQLNICDAIPPVRILEKEKKRKEKRAMLAGIIGLGSDDERLEMYLSTDDENSGNTPAPAPAPVPVNKPVDTVKTRRVSVGLFRAPDGGIFCPLAKEPTPEEEDEEISELTEEVILITTNF
eukprot:sb/3465376/